MISNWCSMALSRTLTCFSKARMEAIDMHYITLRMQYRNLGLSIKETDKMFFNCNMDSYKDYMMLCSERLKKEQLDLEIRIRGFKRHSEKVSMIKRHLGQFMFVNRPAMWRHPHIINGSLLDDQSSVRARKILLDTMPLTIYSFSFDSETSAQSPYAWAQIFGNSEYDNTGRLSSIACPTLIIWGTQDEIFLKADEDMLLDALTGTEPKFVPIEASHNVHWDSKAIAQKVSDLIMEISIN